MTLDVREPSRERPAPLTLTETLGDKRPGLRTEMKQGDELDADKTRQGWNIPSCGDVSTLMSRLSLSPGVGAIRRVLKVALAQADDQEVERLRETAARKETAQFVQHLQALLRKTSLGDAPQKKDEANTDASKQDDQQRVTSPAETKALECTDKLKKKKKDTLGELKDGDNLCPRSPMRQQHNHASTFPYQNTSRKHHSGGYISTVVYSDPIAPTPHYQNHMDAVVSCFTSSPPVGHVAEPSGCADSEAVMDISDLDKKVLMDMVKEYLWSPFQKRVAENNEADLIPTTISELDSPAVDRRVPEDSSNILEDLLSVSSPAASWGGDYSDESGCYSLSPDSVLSSSPGGGGRVPRSPDSGHVVPDLSGGPVPNMSPSGHFFDDHCPYAAGHDLAKEAAGPLRVASPAGYWSLGVPSPATSLDDVHEDFDTKLQVASNDILCRSLEDFDPGDLLLKFRDESSPPRSDGFCPMVAAVEDATNVTDDLRFAAERSAVSPAHPDLNFNVADVEFYGVDNCLAPNFSYVDATPSTVTPGNVQLGVLLPVMQAKVVSPPAPTLKQLKPKVEQTLRLESGKERMLQLMDKAKKANAWGKVSEKLKELNTKDEEGDTQLMILCTNMKDDGKSNLEYAYALVEMLKKVPGALSAVNSQNESALYQAALYSKHPHRGVVVQYIAETLLELGEDINYPSETGNTLLHEICQQGDQRYDVLVELLSLKNKDSQCCHFNVNQYNHEGRTPLHLAAWSHGVNAISCLKTVRLLVAEGADVSLPETLHANTALHMGVLRSCAPSLMEALLSGAAPKNERACRMINRNRDSPLHSAASRNDLPLEQQMRAIRVLLKHGAVKSLNTAGKFPIALVAEERRQEIKRVYEK